MRFRLFFIVPAVIVSSFFCTEKINGKSKLIKIWETDPVLQVPESVMYDSVNKVLYISNINGMPTVKDGNGFISRVGLDGKILTLKWVTGFDAPKGMGIFNNKLYVTDIDRIHEIDIEKGKIISTVKAKSAKFLNDIAIDDTGNVYISDMDTNRIYLLSGNKLEIWKTLKFTGPNGMFYQKGELIVGTGQGIVVVDIKSGKESLSVKNSGGIDGLKVLGENRYIVSDWAGKTAVIGTNPAQLLNTIAEKINSADLEYIPEKKLVIIPTFFHNTAACYKLE